MGSWWNAAPYIFSSILDFTGLLHMALGKKAWPDRLLISKVSTSVASSDNGILMGMRGEFWKKYEGIYVQR